MVKITILPHMNIYGAYICHSLLAKRRLSRWRKSSFSRGALLSSRGSKNDFMQAWLIPTYGVPANQSIDQYWTKKHNRIISRLLSNSIKYPQVKVDEAVSECWNSSGGTDAAKKIGCQWHYEEFCHYPAHFPSYWNTNTSHTLLTWKGLDSSSDNGKIRSHKELFKCSSKGKSSEVLGDLPTVMEER